MTYINDKGECVDDGCFKDLRKTTTGDDMSDEIKRYYPTLTCRGASVGMKESPSGQFVDFYDHDNDKQQAIAAAVQAERERCRKEEVDLLMKALRRAGSVFGREMMECDAGDVDDAIAAVEDVQQEKP